MDGDKGCQERGCLGGLGRWIGLRPLQGRVRARKIARLIEKAEKTIEEVRGLAQDIINKLTYKGPKFVYEYTNGRIEIEATP